MKDTTNRIRELRRSRGLTAVELGKLVGTTGVTISRLETGDRRLTVDWMEKLAGALGCQAHELMAQPNQPRVMEDIGPAPDSMRPMADALIKRQLAIQSVHTDVLELSGIAKGSLVTIDGTAKGISEAKDGDIVLAKIRVPGDGDRLILRHYIQPRILITNNKRAPSLLLLDDPALDAVIVGVVVR